MNIYPINPYKHNENNKVSFSSCTRIYSPKKIMNADIFQGANVRTTSSLFRNDLDWDFLIEHICWSFLNKPKVNIYSLACSDGSEPYTYAMLLANKAPESYYKKFSPIIACDIDPEMIKIAKSGKINLYKDDIVNMGMHLKNINQYIKRIGSPIKIKNNVYNDESAYEIAPNIRKMVKFKKSDILTELKKIKDDGNTVVNIRNVFPYLNKKYIDEILKTLNEKLQSGSIFVFGGYDHKILNFRQHLHDLGFYSPVANGNFVQKI